MTTGMSATPMGPATSESGRANTPSVIAQVMAGARAAWSLKTP